MRIPGERGTFGGTKHPRDQRSSSSNSSSSGSISSSSCCCCSITVISGIFATFRLTGGSNKSARIIFFKRDDCINKFHVIKRHKRPIVTQDVQQAYTAIREDLM